MKLDQADQHPDSAVRWSRQGSADLEPSHGMRLGRTALLALSAAAFGALTLFVYWHLVSRKFGSVDSPNAFGDSFGAANAYLQFLSVFGIVVTLMLQMRELRMQREVAERNRQEAARSATALEDQLKASEELVAAQREQCDLELRRALLESRLTVMRARQRQVEKLSKDIESRRRTVSEGGILVVEGTDRIESEFAERIRLLQDQIAEDDSGVRALLAELDAAHRDWLYARSNGPRPGGQGVESHSKRVVQS